MVAQDRLYICNVVFVLSFAWRSRAIRLASTCEFSQVQALRRDRGWIDPISMVAFLLVLARRSSFVQGNTSFDEAVSVILECELSRSRLTVA